MIESFHVAIALAPIAVYFLMIAWVRLIPRPLVVSGGRDIATLAIGLSGAVAIGPMELFFPRAAASILGSKVWLLLFLLYVLCVLLAILASRPRLVIYGLGVQELHEHLQVTLQELDPGTSWMGEHVHAPSLGISAIVEKAGPGKVSQLMAVSHRQDLRGWFAVEQCLVKRFQSVKIHTMPTGFFYLTLGLMTLAIASFALLRDPVATAESMRQMMRF